MKFNRSGIGLATSVFLFMLASAVSHAQTHAITTAECPAQFVQRLTAVFSANPAVTIAAPARLLVCQSNQMDTSDGLARLSVQLRSANGNLITQVAVPLDIAGQLRTVEQLTPTYLLNAKGHALALTLQVRAHEVDYDQHSTELWLFWYDGKTIQQILTTNLELQQWPTQCADSNNCQERIHETSRLVMQPANIQEFPRLTIYKTREVFATGASTAPSAVFTEHQEYGVSEGHYEPLTELSR